MKAIQLLIFMLITSTLLQAQVVDCYPNCNVDFKMICKERVPTFVSVTSINTKCDSVINTMIAQFEKDDAAQYTFLHNQYCAALSGWQQNTYCEHGGPPPCCPRPLSEKIWLYVGPEKAKAILLAQWHTLQSQRSDGIEESLHDCLKNLNSERLDQFNQYYTEAVDCYNNLRQNKDWLSTHTTTLNNYLYSLNSELTAAQNTENSGNGSFSYSGSTAPNQMAIYVNEMRRLKEQICNTETSAATAIKKKKQPTDTSPTRQPITFPLTAQQQTVQQKQTAQQKRIQQNQQQTQVYINNAQNNSDNSINQALNTSLAQINAMRPGGSTLQQRQQIQQMQQQQNIQNAQNLGSAIGNLAVGITGLINSGQPEVRDENGWTSGEKKDLEKGKELYYKGAKRL